jgi:hypothetical protein
MTLTISPPPPAARQATRRQTASPARTERDRAQNEPGVLGRYLDPEDRLRQVVVMPGARGSVLVVDRDATTREDLRLVAHLAADEPPENAAIVCDHYLRDTTGHWCRRVTPGDLRGGPFAQDEEQDPEAEATPYARRLTDKQGRCYRLELCRAEMSIPELRWHRRSPVAGSKPAETVEPVTMREAIASLESYEPVRTLTHRALVAHSEDPAVSTVMLHNERARLESSEIVLNRGLRRAALAAAAAQDVSMSEIALRCGKVKRDSRGNESGETSWLARRLGLAPESGERAPTPWIHTDVLALIARCGLGISPREVELG